jgi:RHS repeat-associated protein
VVNSYAYTYNEQDLRSGEAAVEAAAPSPYAEALVNYEYNNVNALLRLTDPGDKPLTYDAAGNLLQGYTPAGSTFTATYDSRSRLSTFSYTDGSGAPHQIQLGYMSNKLIKKGHYKNGWQLIEARRYIYDGDLLVQERDQYNNVVNEYTHGLGLPGGIGGLLSLNQGGAYYSYLYDGKGNVTALLDANASVAAAYQYDPFGKPMGPANTLSQPLQFSTKSYDEKTGLSYYGYRFYAPSIGRWLTRDPLGERGGINQYRFVGNNPVNWVDPMGLDYMDINISIGFGLFGVTGGAMFDDNGNTYPYLGGGLMLPGFGASCTSSKDSATPGLNAGVQGGYGVAQQYGYSFADGSTFNESGIGSPGLSGTVFWVGGPYKW